MAVADYFDTVQKIYIAFYQRPADPAGLRYWAQRAEAAGSEAAVINAFANSAEATDLYGPIDNDTIGDVIDSLYQALFNRAPDEAGKTFYVQAFQNGELTAGNIALAVLNAAQGDDRVAIDNKLTVANEFTAQVDGRDLTDPAFGTGSTFAVTYNADDVEAARAILAGVTADPATVLSPAGVTDVLKEQIADEGDAIENENSGNTFTLTVGVDTVAGTSGNDVINALSVNPATGVEGTTLNDFDSIDGGAGRDTLNVYLAAGEDGNINAQQVGTVRNVEVVNIYGQAGVDAVEGDGEDDAGTPAIPAVTLATADASKYQGVEEFWQINAATNVTKLGEGTAAGFRNIEGALSVAAADAAKSATVALDKVSDASTLTVSGTALAAVTVAGTVVDAGTDGVDSIALNITAGKDVQTVTVNTAVASTLVVGNTGTKAVNTVDASASTGDISYVGGETVNAITTGTGDDTVTIGTEFSATVKTASVSTGEGNDTITIDPTGTTGDVTVDAGAGDDTVIVGSIGDVSTKSVISGGEGTDVLSTDGGVLAAEDYTLLNEIFTNFEELEFSLASQFDASRLANYKSFTLVNGSTEAGITKLADDQAVTTSGNLAVYANGYKAAADGAQATYAGTLDITVADATDVEVVAHAQSINLTVDAVVDGEDSDGTWVELTGDLKTATVNLNNHYAANGDVDGVAQLYVETVDGESLDALTSLTLTGDGYAFVYNDEATDLVTIDASAMTGADTDGDDVIDIGLFYISENEAVETITLGGGRDFVQITASTVDATDSIVGFTLVAAEGGGLDADASDDLAIQGFEAFTAKGVVEAGSLALALVDLAAADGSDAGFVFNFGADTYAYVDDGNGLVDDTDVLVKLVGGVDQGLLVEALNDSDV